VASGENLPLIGNRQWMRGTEGNAARIPEEVAVQLRGRQFANWQDFRESFWRAVHNVPHLRNEFNLQNQGRMAEGLAPRAVVNQQIGPRKSYELDHSEPIGQGGNVYDMNNIIVRTPTNHMDR